MELLAINTWVFAAIEALLLVVIVRIIGEVCWFTYRAGHKSVPVWTSSTPTSSSALKINSERVGLSVKADKFCDSEKIHKTHYGKSRTWKFKQFNIAHPRSKRVCADNIYCYMINVQYDFVRIH